MLIKRKRNGEKYTRQFYLDEHEGFISYRQSEKVFAQSHCCKQKNSCLFSSKLICALDYIHKIDEIRSGFHTRTFDRLVRREMIERTDVSYNEFHRMLFIRFDQEHLAFSIFYNNYRDELHLTANNEQTRDLWVQGLRYLSDIHARKRQQHVINETK